MDKQWETLFRLAMDQLDASNLTPDHWALGGGTALMMYFDHRLSKDIDIFFSGAQYLGAVSPRLNDAVEDTLKSYSEHPEFTRLYFDQGEVDFNIGKQISKQLPVKKQLLDRLIRIEHPVEIVAKKVHYRADAFKARDVFDLAVVYEAQMTTMLANGDVFCPHIQTLQERLSELDLERDLKQVVVLPGARKIAGREREIFSQFLRTMERTLRQEEKVDLARKHGRQFSR